MVLKCGGLFSVEVIGLRISQSQVLRCHRALLLLLISHSVNRPVETSAFEISFIFLQPIFTNTEIYNVSGTVILGHVDISIFMWR